MDNFSIFTTSYGLDKNMLKQALTHQSYYKNNDDINSNRRLVFAGMYVFKGQIANILYSYYSGTGTQLQHVLGNLFKNEYLNKLFDNWKIKNKIRAGANFSINNYKHIFVYAILGCVSTLDDENRQRFVFQYIINNDTAHIFKHIYKNKDLINQAQVLAKSNFGKHLTTEMQLTENNLHVAIINYNDNTEVCRAESKSYKYARKKAMKLAINILSEINFNSYVSETDYLERIRKRIELEKEIYKKELENKLKQKEERRLENVKRGKRIKKAKDAARKKAQALAKKRKIERNALAVEKEKKKKPLSTAKRRFLEDKKQ